MFDFSDQVVLVTGAAGNLGKAVAHTFQAAGAKLVLVDRAPDRLKSLFADLVGSPDHFLATSVDLVNIESVKSMVEEAIRRLGRIDVLVNAAGGNSRPHTLSGLGCSPCNPGSSYSSVWKRLESVLKKPIGIRNLY